MSIKELQDIFIQEQAVALKERATRQEWWRILRKLKDEYGDLLDAVQGQFDMDSFDTYVVRNYGVKIMYDKQGNIEGFYEIADKNKHLLFLMRYGQ